MLATVSPTVWGQFAGIFNQGSLYRITNVHVSQARGVLRPVRSSNCIAFLPTTVVEMEPVDDFVIPRNHFELIQLAELANPPRNFPLDEVPVYSTGNSINTLRRFNLSNYAANVMV